MGWGKFVVRESYSEVNGGSSVGGAGSLRLRQQRWTGDMDEELHHIPPTFSLASNATGSHEPLLYCRVSLMIFSAAKPDGPAPIMHIRFRSIWGFRSCIRPWER